MTPATDLVTLSDAPNCDTTVVVTDRGHVVCRNCLMHGCAVFDGPRAAFLHLLVHQRAGHRVRRGALEGLAVAAAVRQNEASSVDGQR